MPRISVVVPFADAARWLPACLDGLARQHFPRNDVEFLFVNNGSRDDGPEIVARQTWIRLLDETSPGAYAARNRALREARGEIVAFLDPDCVPSPDWLSRIAEGMRDPDVGILIGGYTLADRPPAVRPLIAYENEKTSFVYALGDPLAYFGHTNNMAVRRHLLEETGGFVERLRGSDTIFVRRVVDAHGPRVARADDQLLVSHLEIDSTATYWRKLYTYGRSRESYRALSYTRSLTYEERWTVFRRTVRRQRYGVRESGRLFALLLIGATAWAAGRLRGRFLA